MAAADRVLAIENAAHFDSEMTKAGSKLVVIDFTATWCGPCKRIAPLYAQMSVRYPTVIFLKVDVDRCEDVTARFGVNSMPTFLFLRNKVKLGEVRGANSDALESKIKELVAADGAEDDSAALVPGHIDLADVIDKASSECLNEADDHPFTAALHSGGGYLESDCDEQLLLFLTFNQPVRLHTLQIQSPNNGHAPKTVRLFINKANTMDFDSAESDAATQEFVLGAGQTTGDGLIPLTFVKYQNVQTLSVFVKDNQGGEETTIIDHVALFGTPVNLTNMKEFKRVSGKPGEVHGH